MQKSDAKTFCQQLAEWREKVREQQEARFWTNIARRWLEKILCS